MRTDTEPTDIVIPFPSPAGGMCWPPRRAAPTAELNERRIEQLRCAVAAMAPRDARPRVGPPILQIDAEDVRREDGTLASPGEAFQMGRKIGLDQGERRYYPRGWMHGLLCGVVLMVAIGGAVVLVFGRAGYLAGEQMLHRENSLPAGKAVRPLT